MSDASVTPRRARPKVLWLSKGLSRGGAEVLLKDLARQEPLHTFELHVATALATHVDMIEEFSELGLEVHNLGGRATLDPAWIFGLVRLLRAERFDIVHSHSPLPASATRVIASMLCNGPLLVCTEHNMQSKYATATRLLNRLTAKCDDLRIAVSVGVSNSFKKKSAAPTILYHGRDMSDASVPRCADMERMRCRAGVSAGDTVFVTIANLRPEKNIELLIRAFDRCSRTLKGRLPRLIVVGDGECRKDLEELCTRLASGDRIAFVGAVPDGRTWLHIAHAFVSSSDFEGLPVAMMEAIELGVPIVATDVGGVSEIVHHQTNGLLTSAGSVTGLAQALSVMATDIALREKLRQGCASVAPRFSVGAAAGKHAEIYTQLLSNEGG